MAARGLRVATFNVHCGVDGWGRPFDVTAPVAGLDADVLVVQESWAPDGGDPSTAATVAGLLGYAVTEVPLAHGRLYGPDPAAGRGWGPWWGHGHDTLRLDGDRRGRAAAGRQDRPSATGTWSLALLSRVPVGTVETVDLGRLRRDPARRAMLRCTVAVDGRELTVVGAHMSHLLQGSPVTYRRARRALSGTGGPAVLAGDMNLWGPPVTALLPGWRRAVTGRTWPAARPHSQPDHILVTGPVAVTTARVGEDAGSDHRPVVAVVEMA